MGIDNHISVWALPGGKSSSIFATILFISSCSSSLSDDAFETTPLPLDPQDNSFSFQLIMSITRWDLFLVTHVYTPTKSSPSGVIPLIPSLSNIKFFQKISHTIKISLNHYCSLWHLELNPYYYKKRLWIEFLNNSYQYFSIITIN